MKIRKLQFLAVALSCVGMTMSPVAMAAPAPSVAQAARAVQAPRDVALQANGVLKGQVVNAQGVVVAGAAVSVKTAGKEVARVLTDQAGNFQVVGLKGGVHVVATAHQQDIYRLWAPNTAPPAAQKGLMLVPSTDLVRGQGCGTGVNCGSACGGGGGFRGAGGGGGVGQWIATHPLLTTASVATAIAVPLALADDDDATD